MPYDLARVSPSLSLLRLSEPVSGEELVAQRIRLRLQTWVGEVLSDARAGLWSPGLLDTFTPRTLTQRIVAEVESVRGVSRVIEAVDSYDRASRRYRLDLVIRLAGAGIVRVQVGPLIPGQPSSPWAIIMETA